MPHVEVYPDDAALAEPGAVHLLEAPLVLDAAVVRQTPAVGVPAKQATEGLSEAIEVHVPCSHSHHLHTDRHGVNIRDKDRLNTHFMHPYIDNIAENWSVSNFIFGQFIETNIIT